MKIGIVLNDLGANQAAFMTISYINTILQHQNPNLDITLFYCNNVPVIVKPMVAAMNVDKIFSFNGTLIATDLYTASLIAKTKGKKFLYLWDLEWLYGKGFYIANVNLLKNSDITLMCRSEYHAKVIRNYCGVEPITIPNFNLVTILENINHETI